MRGLAQMGMPYRGVLYAGLMLTAKGPRLVEYNIRFGDPECQVLMPRLESDLLDLLMAASRDGGLAGKQAHWRSETALTVVMAAHGYPGAYRKGTAIGGLDRIDDADTIVFHAGTTRRDGDILATGGRVLCVTGLAPTSPGRRRRPTMPLPA